MTVTPINMVDDCNMDIPHEISCNGCNDCIWMNILYQTPITGHLQDIYGGHVFDIVSYRVKKVTLHIMIIVPIMGNFGEVI